MTSRPSSNWAPMPERTGGATPAGDGRSSLAAEVAALVRLSAAVAVADRAGIERGLRAARVVARADHIEEALLQSYLFVGFPAALNAITAWREFEPEPASAVEGLAEAVCRERGETVCRVVYGRAYEGLRDTVAALHPDLDRWMVSEGYGKVLGRPGLDLVVRELCIVALLVGQDAPRQLHSHLRGALNAGATTGEVEAALEAALAEAGTVLSASRRQQAHDVWRRVRERHGASHHTHESTSEGR